MTDNETDRATRKAETAMMRAVDHLETIDPSLEPFDSQKNREVKRRLESAIERLNQ